MSSFPSIRIEGGLLGPELLDQVIAAECLLEKYHAQTIEQGGRVREHLRDGGEECLKLLGNGFLAHKDNDDLRQKLESKQLSPAQFYRQLFRVVYRFLFLLVSEDRGLISRGGCAPHGWNHPVWKTVFSSTPRTATGKACSPAKTQWVAVRHVGRQQRPGKGNLGWTNGAMGV